MAKYLTNLRRKTDIQIQEVQQSQIKIPSPTDLHKDTSQSNCQGKSEDRFSNQQDKRDLSYSREFLKKVIGLLSRHPADWQRRGGGQIQKAGGWRRKACKPRTRYPANDSFKSERQMKNFPGKQNLLDLTYRECNGNKRL